MLLHVNKSLFCATGLSVLVFGGAAFAQQGALESGRSFEFYGQVNLGYLSYDDGAVVGDYFPVDNDNSGTRFGILYSSGSDSDWTVGARFEMGVSPNSTTRVNLNDPNDSSYELSKQDIRHLEMTFVSDEVGKFYVGQGSMATDGIAGTDLSGTGVTAGVSVKDSAAGQLLRTVDGDLNGEQIKGHFTDHDGGRLLRLRYDSPNYNGFVFSGSYGQNVLNDQDENEYYDIAGRYAVDADEYVFEAALGFSWNDQRPDILVGSAAVLHKSTGLSLSISSGAALDTSGYGYAKAGYESDLVKVGSTAFSLDYYSGNDINSDGANSKSYGFAVVQNFDKQNLELYGTIRQYEVEEVTVKYQDSKAFLAGLRFRF